MARKYVFVRMPDDVFQMFYMKKIKMEKDIKEVTGRNIPLTMPKVFRLVAKHPVEMDINNLLDVANKRKRLRL